MSGKFLETSTLTFWTSEFEWIGLLYVCFFWFVYVIYTSYVFSQLGHGISTPSFLLFCLASFWHRLHRPCSSLSSVLLYCGISELVWLGVSERSPHSLVYCGFDDCCFWLNKKKKALLLFSCYPAEHDSTQKFWTLSFNWGISDGGLWTFFVAQIMKLLKR